MIGDDERSALSKRFAEEGLDTNLPDEKKLPHVWRWLTDAESNCMSLRKQIEKLYKQQETDIREVEEYVEHVWKLSNDKLIQLEGENKRLSTELEGSRRVSQHNVGTVTLEGPSNLCDSLKIKSGVKHVLQVAIGQPGRGAACKEQLEPDIDSPNGLNTEKGLNQLQLMCQEYEDKLSQQQEIIRVLQKSKKQVENENETLAYKLSEMVSLCDRLEERRLTWREEREANGNHENNETHLETTDVETNVDQLSINQTLKSSTETDSSLEALPSEAHRGKGQSSPSLPLVKQIRELNHECDKLRAELRDKQKEYTELLIKYDKRKGRHRERISRLRDHIERDNKRWQQVLEAANGRRLLAEKELESQKKSLNALLSEDSPKQGAH